MLLPESMQLSSLPVPVREGTVFDKYLHARNGHLPRRNLHRVVCRGRQLEDVQCLVLPASKVAELGQEEVDCHVLISFQTRLRCHEELYDWFSRSKMAQSTFSCNLMAISS